MHQPTLGVLFRLAKVLGVRAGNSSHEDHCSVGSVLERVTAQASSSPWALYESALSNSL